MSVIDKKILMLTALLPLAGAAFAGAEYKIGKALVESCGKTENSIAPYTDENGGIWRFGLAPKGGAEPVEAMPNSYNVYPGVGYSYLHDDFGVPALMGNADPATQDVNGATLNQHDAMCHPAPHEWQNCCNVSELTVPESGSYALRLVVADYGDGSRDPGDPGYSDGVTASVYTNGIVAFSRLVSVEQGMNPWSVGKIIGLAAGDRISLAIDPNGHYAYDTTAFEFKLSRCAPVADKASAYTLDHSQMAGGMIDERIMRVINNHYMVVDADTRWVDHFLNRTQCPAFFINAGMQQRYEGFGKFIDAGALFSEYSKDPAVAEKTKHLLAALRETRDEDGYIGFWTHEEDNHQEWMNWTVHDQEYIMLAQLRCYLAFGDPAALEDAKTMARYLMDNFPTPENGIEGRRIDGLTVSASVISTAGLPEAFLVLYNITGDREYLDFAANVKHGNNETEIRFDSLMRWNQRITPDASDGRCHVYVMTSRNYAETELYRCTGIDSLLAMSKSEYAELFKRDGGGMLVTGSSSEGEFFSYTQNGHGHIEESCVTSYLMRWLESLMRLDGDFSIGDILERTMYNALFAANSPDGRKIRYFTCFEGEREWDSFDDGFCCCGNFRRAIAELPKKVCYQTADGRLAVNFYTPLDATFDVGGKTLSLACSTDYPNSGIVDFTVGADSDVPLALRIPRWCKGATVRVNGETAKKAVREGDGLFTLRREWKAGDRIRLELPMDWRLVRGTKNQRGYVALMRGPMLFCIGKNENAAAVARGVNFKALHYDVASIGAIEPDGNIRSAGMKVAIDAYPSAERDPAAKETVVFTEFADPSGVMTYFTPFAVEESGIDFDYDELLDFGPGRIGGKKSVNIDIDGKQPADAEPVTYSGPGFSSLVGGDFWNSLYAVEFERQSYTLENLMTADGTATTVAMTLSSRDGNALPFDNLGGDQGALGNALEDDYMYLINRSADLVFSGLFPDECYDLYCFVRPGIGDTYAEFGGVRQQSQRDTASALVNGDLLSFKGLVADGNGVIAGMMEGTTYAGVYYGFQLVGRFFPESLSLHFACN